REARERAGEHLAVVPGGEHQRRAGSLHVVGGEGGCRCQHRDQGGGDGGGGGELVRHGGSCGFVPVPVEAAMAAPAGFGSGQGDGESPRTARRRGSMRVSVVSFWNTWW